MHAVSYPIQKTSFFGELSINAWVVDEYYVAVAFQDGPAVRLDIHTADYKDGLPWDVLQGIKNACGFADKDAVEYYPAAADVINCENMRHLYVFNEKLPLIRRGRDG